MKLSVFIVGPSKSGKTRIANHLAELSDSLNYNEYHPTQGVRILECDKKIQIDIKKSKKDVQVGVEIWDCSGDASFYSSWPALAQDAHALIYVCSPESKSDDNVDTWYPCANLTSRQSLFQHLKPLQTVIFAHQSGSNNSKKPAKLKINNKAWSKTQIVNTSLDDESETLKSEFDRLLSNAVSVIYDNREKEEQSIVAAA